MLAFLIPIINALSSILLPDIVKAVVGDSPVGQKVGEAAIAVVSKVAGIPITDEHSARNAAQAIVGDPDKVMRVFKLQADEVMALLKLDNDDRADARSQTVELAKAGSGVAWGAPVMSIMVVIGFFVVMGLLFVMPQTDMPERTFNLLNMLFGALVLGFGQVTNYWLGSSAGSAAKDKLLHGR